MGEKVDHRKNRGELPEAQNQRRLRKDKKRKGTWKNKKESSKLIQRQLQASWPQNRLRE